MVRYNIDDVNENMVLGESIFLPTGELLLAAGQSIKDRYKQRLVQLGYTNIMIQVEGTELVEPVSVVSDSNQREMNVSIESSSKELNTAFQQFRQKSSAHVKEIIRENRQHLTKFIMNSGMAKALEQFIEEIMAQTSIVLNLSALQQTQTHLIQHALNVTITSLCIGKRYRLSYEEMKQLGIGALNYDLGLIALPKELLEKRVDQMSEEEIKLYHQHTIFGFLLLSQNHMIPSTSAAVALQHHEYENGNGFPRGLKGDNRPPLKDFSRQNMIHRFAEIVAVADMYDVFTNGRTHLGVKPSSIQQAIKQLIGMSGQELNSDIVKALVSIVPVFPIGARIKIVSAPATQLIGYIGVVAKDNAEELEYPTIILYETKKNQRIKPILIDLSKHKAIQIEVV